MLARDLDVPIIALSQLSRAVEQRHDKRPILSDLRESGSIEQDADLVGFVYRDEYYNGEESDQQGLAEVILAKHRNGPTDTIKLSFLKRYAKFADLAAAIGTGGLDDRPDDLALTDEQRRTPSSARSAPPSTATSAPRWRDGSSSTASTPPSRACGATRSASSARTTAPVGVLSV